jgi:hypothetical protein
LRLDRLAALQIIQDRNLENERGLRQLQEEVHSLKSHPKQAARDYGLGD